MLYSEFVENTGCRENDYNYTVYKRLELAYMNDDTFSKQEVYEWGKRLVNNDLTPEQKALNEEIRQAISVLNDDLTQAKYYLDRYKEYARTSYTREDRRYWNEQVRTQQEYIARIKADIAAKKACIIK